MVGPRLLVVAFALALAAPLSGCFTCQPQLDVHHCRNEAGRCDTLGEVVADWNPELRDLFPDVDRLVNSVAVGKHAHAEWTHDEEATFWSFYQVPADREDKQVFLRWGGELFQVRVLTCD